MDVVHGTVVAFIVCFPSVRLTFCGCQTSIDWRVQRKFLGKRRMAETFLHDDYRGHLFMVWTEATCLPKKRRHQCITAPSAVHTSQKPNALHQWLQWYAGRLLATQALLSWRQQCTCHRWVHDAGGAAAAHLRRHRLTTAFSAWRTVAHAVVQRLDVEKVGRPHPCNC